MPKTATQKTPAAESAWRIFKSRHEGVIERWLAAEGSIASSLEEGQPDATLGDRLLSAEADLQRAIVDFAAGQADGADPTAVALSLLRRAEGMLRRRGSSS